MTRRRKLSDGSLMFTEIWLLQVCDAVMGMAFARRCAASQRDGRLRPDVGVSDIRMALMAISRVASSDSELGRTLVQRFLDIVLDGLRAPGHSTLAGQPPSIAESEDAFSPPGEAGSRTLRRGRRRWPVET